MPGNVDPVADEREGLVKFLAQQRDALRISVHGLTEEQARTVPSASSISLGGLIKHAARTELGWLAMIPGSGAEPVADRDWATDFQLVGDETLAGALEFYGEVASKTEAFVATADLSQPVPVPKGVPWFPKDVDFWSVRWVLFHLIEETARHAGHADITRESLDGQTFYALMAAAEGTPGF